MIQERQDKYVWVCYQSTFFVAEIMMCHITSKMLIKCNLKYLIVEQSAF